MMSNLDTRMMSKLDTLYAEMSRQKRRLIFRFVS